MQPSQPTQKICERIAAVRFESLDSSTIYKVKEAIRDGLAVSIAGCKQRPVTILAEYVRGIGATPVVTVWGHGFKTSPASAVLVNAASAHVLDYEPMSSPSTHAVSPVLPAVIALAEAESRGGRDIVTACAKGFEMQHRLLHAAAETARAQRRFHPPGMVGVMGSAVAAGHLLDLDTKQLRNALGIAASRAGALLANAGTMTKCTHTGNAAAAGLEAALLAQRGFDANENILEHAQGYVAAFMGGDTFDYARLLDFGNPFRIVDPGMAFKFFPSKYPTQFAITAALELHARIGDPSRITRVSITTPLMADVDRPKPQSGLEGKFSFQYGAAAALLDGKVRIDSFSDARRFRPDMEELLSKIQLTQSQEIPLDFRKMYVSLSVETKDGTRHVAECRTPKGFWGVSIRPEEHREKLRDCMSQLMTDAQIEECVGLTNQLEDLDAGGVKQLVKLMSGQY